MGVTMANRSKPMGHDAARDASFVATPSYVAEAANGLRPAANDGLGVRIMTEGLRVSTRRDFEFVDITDDVANLVKRSGIQNGIAVIFSRHTTAAVRINENEPGLIQDMEGLLQRLIPRSAYYRHNDLSVRTINLTDEEDANGHAHCQHLFLGASESIPIVGGRLVLGRWQRLFLIELDKPRDREVVIQLLGL